SARFPIICKPMGAIMFGIRTGFRSVQLTMETLEGRDVPSAYPAADLPRMGESLVASSASAACDTRPLSQSTASGQDGETDNTKPRWDPHQTAAYLFREFRELFGHRNNLWGIQSVDLLYFAAYEKNGQQRFDVRFALKVAGREGLVDFRMD